MMSCFPKKKTVCKCKYPIFKIFFVRSIALLEFFLLLFVKNFQRSNFKIAVCKTTGAFPCNEQKIRERIILHPLKKKKSDGFVERA